MDSQPAHIYLNMILKESEPVDTVRRSIESVRPFVDDVYITVTYNEDRKKAEESDLAKYLLGEKFHVNFFKWVKDFAAARNFAMAVCPHGPKEFIYWQDADDVLRGGQNLRRLVDEAVKFNVAAWFFHYYYMVDLDDKGEIREIVVDHKRERIIRNDYSFKWVSRLHELLVEQKAENVDKRGVDADTCVVVHLTTPERVDSAIDRNVEILEAQAAVEQHKDPRTLVYLARAYYDKGKMQKDAGQAKIFFDLAITLFHEYLEGSGEAGTESYREGSGWAEERSTAWAHVAEIAILSGNYDIAIQAYESAIHEAPQFPSLYIDLALVYTMLGDFAKAKHWLRVATNTAEPETTIITTPRDMKMRALEVDYQISLREGKFDVARRDLEMMKQVTPNDKGIDERMASLKSIDANNKAAQSLVYLGKFLEANEGDKTKSEKLKNLVNAMPASVEQERFAAEMQHRFLGPQKHGEDEMAILCGPGVGEWSPASVKTGVGGSEEAVIHLSQELKKLGWKVTVYANPGPDAGDHEGVMYLPYYKLNPFDEFNVLILWRTIGAVDFNPKAKLTMVWMHDVPNIADFTPERVNKVDKIAVLSEFHKSLLKISENGTVVDMPSKKVFLTSNGIIKMKPSKRVKRDPKRMIYCSSPDRGLIYLLKMWPDIIKEVPDANLHVFYGFDTYDVLHAGNPARMKWKQMILDAMKQPGIVYHGKVGHTELQKEFAQSGIWAYPTDFDEISCISAMKAQALGAIPVTTTQGALKETVRNGIKVDMNMLLPESQEEYKKQLIKMLKNTKNQEELRPSMMKWAQEYFLWSKVAQQWDAQLRTMLQHPEMLNKPVTELPKEAIKEDVQKITNKDKSQN